ncbi:uncharacterized protein LOC114175342 [Vigna unguiculata]|uniref:uncharacterized protein LOC114175342 n=1 Tax=Vigna unguiculata TaxID=3917 RepID=UPI0010163D73|nr:uncharacterized protein LOC114175342 [Vigna unguiculata]
MSEDSGPSNHNNGSDDSEGSEGGDVGEFSDSTEIMFRHSCRTTYLSLLNKNLSEDQKLCIQRTPFWWFTLLNDSVKISRNVLGLGLRIVGDVVDLDEVVIESVCRNIFSQKKVTVGVIYNYLLNHSECVGVDDFCRLYIFIGISEFFLPNRNATVFPILFKIVDDLKSLCQYNWGRVVYEYLVGSLCNASLVLKMKRHRKHFHVVGCVYLLQLWCFDHFLFVKRKGAGGGNEFPRLLRRMNIKVGDGALKSSLEKNVIVVDLCVSKQELLHAVVREAYEVFGHEVGRSNRQTEGVDLGTRKVEVEVLIERQEREIGELRQSLSLLEGVFHERKTERTKECDSVTPSTNVHNERGKTFEDQFYSQGGHQSHEAWSPLQTTVKRNVGVKVGEVNVDTPDGSDEELSKHVSRVEEPNPPQSNMYDRMKLHRQVL